MKKLKVTFYWKLDCGNTLCSEPEHISQMDQLMTAHWISLAHRWIPDVLNGEHNDIVQNKVCHIRIIKVVRIRV
jgi:hypothetical protein